jgi:hypothetical protein
VLVTAVAFGISVGLAWDLDPFQHEGLYKASRSLTIFAFALGLVCLKAPAAE